HVFLRVEGRAPSRPRKQNGSDGAEASRSSVARQSHLTGFVLYLEVMTPSQIVQKIQTRFGEKIKAAFPEDKHPRVHVDAGDWREIAQFLLTDPELKLDWLACHSGVDYVADGKMCCVYDLWSFDHRHSIAVKVYTPREKPSIPSVADFWPAADWHEREAYDLFGIHFPG